MTERRNPNLFKKSTSAQTHFEAPTERNRYTTEVWENQRRRVLTTGAKETKALCRCEMAFFSDALISALVRA
jgi:hypothetical protein